MEFAEVYFDESESGGRWLCVAGWLFSRESREALHEEWSALLCKEGLPYFHQGPCAHGNKPFDHLDGPERDRLQRRFFEALRRNVSHGFCATFDLSLAHLLPHAVDAAGRFHVTPYTLCCYWAFLMTRRWAISRHYKGQIAYFFEAGHSHQPQANRMMLDLFSNPLLCQIFHYAGHGFVKKRESAAVQCADILAWQWSKFIKDREIGKKPRADLLALLTTISCDTVHFDERTIREFLEEINNYGSTDAVSAKVISSIWSGARVSLPSYWTGYFPYGWLPH